MKLSYCGGLVAPLLLLLTGHCGPVSASAARIVVTNATDFVDAIQSASSDPDNPTTIEVMDDAAASTIMNLDDLVDEGGLDLSNKYFQAKCLTGGMMTTTNNKRCILERTVGSAGRFFYGEEQLNVAFEGFEFRGGFAPTGNRSPVKNSGGAFAFAGNGPFAAAFTDCDFVGNTASSNGGALFIRAFNEAASGSALSFTGCIFDGNVATNSDGGGVYALARHTMIDLDILQSAFSNNRANGSGNDIYGTKLGFGLHLTCTETTATSSGGGSDDVSVVGGQACSASAVPSSVPSALPSSPPSAVPTNVPSSTPSDLPTETPSTPPSSPPSAVPSRSPSVPPSNEPSAVPSNAPSEVPSAKPSSGPSMSSMPSVIPSNMPSVSNAPSRGWEVITYSRFEGGWGSFTHVEGHADAIRIDTTTGRDRNKSAYVYDGNGAIQLRDDASGDKGAMWHKRNHDVTGYSELRVDFWFYTRSFRGTDKFHLKYSSDGGDSWVILKTYRKTGNGGTEGDFDNKEFTNKVVTFQSNDKRPFTTTARIRFDCGAGSDNDKLYIDNVKFEGLPK